MMVLHPTISKKLASILACRYYNDEKVVMAAKTISCGDNTCVVTGIFFFFLYTVGIPASNPNPSPGPGSGPNPHRSPLTSHLSPSPSPSPSP